MAEVSPEFSKFAAEALGTDDPAKIAALKEAIVACVAEQEAGEYEDEEEGMPMKKGGMGMLFGGGE